jgi:hypothetical protein
MNNKPKVQRLHINNLAFKVDNVDKKIYCKNLKQENPSYHLISKSEIACLEYVASTHSNKSYKAKEFLALLDGNSKNE